ncbi:MAG: HAD family hydrolase, partial [Acidimicrobiia bacterium]
VADVDGTLLGDDEGWSRLEEALDENPDLLLVPNSSRPLVSLSRSWREHEIWRPFPAQVGALGTEVIIDDRDLGWSDRFDGFDRGRIDQAMSAMGYATNGEEFQTALKASYRVPRDEWAWTRAAISRIAPVRVVTSGESDLDVIPSTAGKSAPMSYLSESLVVDPERVVAAGDSMNDLDLLMASPHRVVVNNAESGLFEATSGLAFHSSEPCAGGVLEGLISLGLIQ